MRHEYGVFGGIYVPETLIPSLLELEKAFEACRENAEFERKLKEYLENYAGRPTPLYYAENISRKWKNDIFVKREDLCHTGAHKINNAIGQVLLAKFMGKKRIIAETGAGQHGFATASVCAKEGMQCTIYMGKIDAQRQKENVLKMKLLGAEIVEVDKGSKTLKDAINEAIRDWITNFDNSYYLLGSCVGPRPYPQIVKHFQSIIGKEAKMQFVKKCGCLPDYVVACVGGGSNSIGIFSAFLKYKNVKLFGAEGGGKGKDMTAATLFYGKPGVLHGAYTYVLQNKDGQIKKTYSIAPGLDYPGVGPEHSYLKETKRVSYFPIKDEEAILAYEEFAREEGIIPAIESSHAIALAKKISREEKGIKILICLSGRGEKDLSNYWRYKNEVR